MWYCLFLCFVSANIAPLHRIETRSSRLSEPDRTPKILPRISIASDSDEGAVPLLAEDEVFDENEWLLGTSEPHFGEDVVKDTLEEPLTDETKNTDSRDVKKQDSSGAANQDSTESVSEVLIIEDHLVEESTTDETAQRLKIPLT